jgi:hypothetical protein
MDSIKSVADILDDTMKDLGLQRAVDLWSIQDAIHVMFDNGFADNIRVLHIKGDVLTLLVPSSVWVQELSFMEKDILEKLNSILNSKIKSIRFKEVY